MLDNTWVDRHEDALNLSYGDNSLDVVIASHMIHHLASPYRFFCHLQSKLKSGGRIIIQDINTSMLMKLALRAMRHEGWDDRADIWNSNAICNQPDDPWSANCSIPKLLFSDIKQFEKVFPGLKIIHSAQNECFMFFCSGGVIAKGPRLPLSKSLTKALSVIDKICVAALPGIFACGRSVVIEKV